MLIFYFIYYSIMWLFGSSEKKYVYFFGETKGLGKDILGGKGKNLSEMVEMGLPIPSGFTITTETCDLYYKSNKTYPQMVLDQIEKELQKLQFDLSRLKNGTLASGFGMN